MKNNYSTTVVRLSQLYNAVLFLTILFISFGVAAQEADKCGSSLLHNEKMQNDPVYAAKMQTYENKVIDYNNNIYQPMGTTSRIVPLVVHVMYDNTPLTYITEDEIHTAIRLLNERARKIPGTVGAGSGVDIEIEFALAVRDPNGNCTNGITWHNMTGYPSYVSSGVRYVSQYGLPDINLKDIARWDTSDYYNLYLVSQIDNNNATSGTAGYAYFAGAHGEDYDGAVMQVNEFKKPESPILIHELGHAFNLYHTFEGSEGTACPPEESDCSTQGDMVCDTPRHPKSLTCGGTNPCSTNNSVVFNYMSYAGSCTNMFTQGQKARVLVAMDETRKSFLASEENLSLVPTALPVADFEMPVQTACIGSSLQFYDKSNCVPNTYLEETEWPGISFVWTVVRDGVTTHTHYSQNPKLTFVNPGEYTVTLSVTNQYGTTSKSKYLNIVSPSTVTVCQPDTFNQPGNYGYTINNVTFNTINNTTSTGVNGGYQDFSCSSATTVEAGETYQLRVTIKSGTGTALQRFEAYIDYNNNGIFEYPSELVSAGTGTRNENVTFAGNVTIPEDAVMGTLLRMRVLADDEDITEEKRNCAQEYHVGDIEDYGIFIKGTPACPEGDITFTTQAEVNQFAIDYPNCSRIAGFLAIKNSSAATAITDLSPLNSLTTIEGSLDINNNTSLTNLSGLSRVASVGGNLTISTNPSLINVDGLSTLTSIEGYLVVNDNALIESISGLQNINPATIGGVYGLNITENPLLSVCNLPNFCSYLSNPSNTHPRTIEGNAGDCISEQALTEICNPTSSYCPTGNITLATQAEVNQFALNYPGCSTITGDLTIGAPYGTSNITDLSALGSLATVSGNLIISYNTSLANLNGLGNITNVGGLFIQNNGLTSLSGLNGLTHSNNLLIAHNNSLLNVNGLNGLTNIGGSVVIQNNAALNNLNGLNNLISATGIITVQDNNALVNISGLQNINPTSIIPSGNLGLTIKNNPVLSVCNLSNFCTYLSYSATTHPRDISENAGDCITEQAVVNACSSSTSNECPTGEITLRTQAQVNQFATDYPNCSVITGNLIIGFSGYSSYSSNITDLSPLSNITSVGGNVEINHNYSLNNLNGLNNLTNIGGKLRIFNLSQDSLNNDDSLTDISALNNLVSIGGDLSLYLWSITNLNSFNSLTSVGGGLTFHFYRINNLDGLNNLTSIGGPVVLELCYYLTNINGLSGLTSIGGYLNINRCGRLENVNGLSSLTSIGGYLKLENNSSLNNLDGLSSLTNFGNAQFGGNIIVQSNAALSNISGLQNADPFTITNLTIRKNPVLSVCDLPNICIYLSNPSNPRTINQNAGDCVSAQAITNMCNTHPACPEDDVYLYTQEDVNQFAIDYPNCTHIPGKLEIYGSDITDLSPLINITSVGGGIELYRVYSLTNVNGLNNLTSIGGTLRLHDNDLLTNLNGLSNLTYIGGNLEIIVNASLSNISGLNNLTSVEGHVEFLNNESLTTLNGLYSLTNIGGDLAITSSYLTNLNGLQSLTQIGGQLYLGYNDYLTNIDGLNNLISIEDSFVIETCFMTNFDSLSNLTTIGGNFSIWSLPSLTNIDGLISLTTIGRGIDINYNSQLSSINSLRNINFAISEDSALTIRGNTSLSVCNLPSFCAYLANDPTTHPRYISGNAGDCISDEAILNVCSTCPPGNVSLSTQAEVNAFAANYPDCTQIMGNLSISVNTGTTDITDLSPLSNIVSVSGSININNNTLLTNIDGLSNIAFVGEGIQFYGNSVLTNVNGLSSLTSIGGRLLIHNNPLLANVNGLNNLISIEGYLNIDGNASLTNLNGLSNLTTIGENLLIHNNASLTNVNGLSNITSIESLILNNNASLANVNGFSGLINIGGDLIISNNASLTNMNGLNSATSVGGNLLIENNATLTNVNGLSNIIGTEGYLHIKNNALLTNIDGLENITSIGGSLKIQENASLTNLYGLSNLTTIAQELEIINNAVLSDISGLQNTTFAPNGELGLTIMDNPMLSVCNLPYFCAYLENNPSTHPRNIIGNEGDCISELAVILACTIPAEGCLNADSDRPQWPTTTFVPSCTNSPEVIANDARTDEYSKVELTAGVEYTFSSSVSTDYITISDEDGEIVYVYGTSSVTWTAINDEVIRFYLHVDDQCNRGDNENISRMVTCSSLSIPESNILDFSYYPNPVKDVLNISYNTEIRDVTIINTLGQLIMTKSIHSKSAQIDMSSLPAGSYFVRATFDKTIKTIVVVKQ